MHHSSVRKQEPVAMVTVVSANLLLHEGKSLAAEREVYGIGTR